MSIERVQPVTQSNPGQQSIISQLWYPSISHVGHVQTFSATCPWGWQHGWSANVVTVANCRLYS